MSERYVFMRYSLAFKQKVVSEIESGKLTIAEARRLYDIRGNSSIQKWLKDLGKNHLLNRVVRVEMKDEKDRLRELEREKQRLESALAQTQLKNMYLEALIECIEEQYNIDVKKKFGDKLSRK